MKPAALLALFVLPHSFAGEEWPQFRGNNSTGIAAAGNQPPTEFGPGRNVAWKTALPAGKSSPIIAGTRIFLTGHDGGKLVTLAINRQTGAILWRQELTRGRTEKPDGAWTPEQTVDFMIERIDGGDFYILCPDNDVPRQLDERRMTWAAGDIIENRPALSRWHPDYAEVFAKFVKGG